MIEMGLSMVLDSHHKSSEFDQNQLMDDSSIKPNKTQNGLNQS